MSSPHQPVESPAVTAPPSLMGRGASADRETVTDPRR